MCNVCGMCTGLQCTVFYYKLNFWYAWQYYLEISSTLVILHKLQKYDLQLNDYRLKRNPNEFWPINPQCQVLMFLCYAM